MGWNRSGFCVADISGGDQLPSGRSVVVWAGRSALLGEVTTSANYYPLPRCPCRRREPAQTRAPSGQWRARAAQGSVSWPVVPCLTPALIITQIRYYLLVLTSPLFPVRILAPPLVFGRGPAMLAARVLAIVRAWSAWRALQGCKPHRRQRSSSPACPLLRLLQSACSRRWP